MAQKEINKGTHLYTVIFRCYDSRETWLDQFTATVSSPEDILVGWAQNAVASKFIKGISDASLVIKDIADLREKIERLDGSVNIWQLHYSMYKGFYILDQCDEHEDEESVYCIMAFIKTDTTIVKANQFKDDSTVPTHRLRLALEKYAAYQQQFIELKAAASRTHAINKQRRKVGKQLIYWKAKASLLPNMYNRDFASTCKNRYTVFAEYFHELGPYVYQFLLPGQDLRYILYKWLDSMLYATTPDGKKILFDDYERLQLLEKLSQAEYGPVPVAGLTNVWATYLTMKGKLACITIIKTALD